MDDNTIWFFVGTEDSVKMALKQEWKKGGFVYRPPSD